MQDRSIFSLSFVKQQAERSDRESWHFKDHLLRLLSSPSASFFLVLFVFPFPLLPLSAYPFDEETGGELRNAGRRCSCECSAVGVASPFHFE